MKKVMMCVGLVAVLAIGVGGRAAIVQIDVNNSGNNTEAETQPGFTPLVMGPDNVSGTVTVDGITVTVSSDTTQRNERWRVPPQPTGYPGELIYRDFIFGRAGGMSVTIEGLTADTTYLITLYSYDTGSNANPPRQAVWTANDQPFLTTIFNGAELPTTEDQYAFSGYAKTDGDGKLFLRGVRGPESNDPISVFVNALIIDYPPIAHDPDPADGATGVAESGPVTLSWKTGLIEDPENPGQAIVNPDITMHYLYMNSGSFTDPNLNLVASIPVTGLTGAYEMADLGLDRRFLWMVEEGIGPNPIPGDPNNLVGQVWTFETTRSVPVINAQPTDQAVFPGETAVFSVDATSITPLTYTWYASADAVADESDTVVLTGIDEDTLEIAIDSDVAAAVSSQGYYYCVLDNGIQVTSDMAMLTIKRLIAHYPFDGSADDVSVQDNDGVWADPTLEAYEPGVIGQAAVFAGEDPNSYINVGLTAPPSSDPFIGGTLEGSVAYWIKTTGTGFMNICGTFNAADNSGFQVNINEGGFGNVRTFIRGGATNNIAVGLGADTTLFDGQWHHLAFTWNAAANVSEIYYDGQRVATRGAAAPQLTPWEFPMVIGARNVRGAIGGFLVGSLDELRLYNYAMPKEEVYDLFLAGPAEWICDTPPEYDWDGNCVVDLADLAAFAAKWLECGRYPAEQCQ